MSFSVVLERFILVVGISFAMVKSKFKTLKQKIK